MADSGHRDCGFVDGGFVDGGFVDGGFVDGGLLTKKSSDAIQNHYDEQRANGRSHRQVRFSCHTWRQQVKAKGASGLPVRGACTPNDDKGVEQNQRQAGNGNHEGQVEDCYLTCRQKIGQKGEASPHEEGVPVAITNGEWRYCSVPGKTGSQPSRLLYRECGETVGGEGMNSVHNNRTCGTPVDTLEGRQGEAYKTPQKMVERVLKRLTVLEESRRLAECEKTEMEEQILTKKEEAIRKMEESAKTLTEQVRLVFERWEQDVKNEMEDLTLQLQKFHGNGRQNSDVMESQLHLNVQRHTPTINFLPSNFEGSVFTLGRIEVKEDRDVCSPRQDVLSTPSRTFTSWKSRFGTSGTKKGQCSEPLCVTTASDQVYVIDRAGGGRVQVFTMKGVQVSEFMLNFGDNLNIKGCGLFSDGRHVTFVGSLCKGAIGVDTTYTNVFLKYTKEGRQVARRTLTVGSGRDPIIDASGFQGGRIAAALTGKVCILATSGDTQSEFDTTVQTYKRVCVDHRNNNILLSLHKTVQVYNERGQRLQELSLEPGLGRGPLNGPHGLCVDGQGNIIVADWSNSRVQMFNGEGGFVETIAGEEDGLVCPWDVSVTRKGCVVAIDWREHCVFLFRY